MHKIHQFLNNRNRNYVILTQIINAAIALVTGKLIAVYIDPEDFGTYNLQWAAFIFFSTIFVVPLIQYIKTTESDLKKKIEIRHYLLTGSILTSITIVSLLILIAFFYDSLSFIIFVLLLLYVPLYTINTVIANYLNIKNRLLDFCYLSIIKVLGSLLCLVGFIFYGISGIKEYEVLWLMQVVGGIIALVFVRRKNFNLSFGPKQDYFIFLKRYLKFAGPLMIMAFWAWINNYFDRYAIEYFLTLKDVGVYNASYSVGSKFFLMISPIFMILLNPIVFGTTSLESKKRNIKRFGLYYAMLALPILSIAYFAYDFIGDLLLSTAYSDGFFIIFLNAMAFFVFTLTQMIELIFYSQKKTKIILYGNIAGALGNIGFNIILVPRLEIIGSAIATLLGFVLYFLVIIYFFKKIKI